jgi:hypothetical protein
MHFLFLFGELEQLHVMITSLTVDRGQGPKGHVRFDVVMTSHREKRSCPAFDGDVDHLESRM